MHESITLSEFIEHAASVDNILHVQESTQLSKCHNVFQNQFNKFDCSIKLSMWVFFQEHRRGKEWSIWMRDEQLAIPGAKDVFSWKSVWINLSTQRNKAGRSLSWFYACSLLNFIQKGEIKIWKDNWMGLLEVNSIRVSDNNLKFPFCVPDIITIFRKREGRSPRNAKRIPFYFEEGRGSIIHWDVNFLPSSQKKKLYQLDIK